MTDERARPKQLGRGLEALFGEHRGGDIAPADKDPGLRSVAISKLSANPAQPRRHFDDAALRDLATSIRDKGILQPLIVRPAPGRAGQFEIVAGERRWRAAQRAQIHELPVIVRDFTDEETLAVALIENIQRDDLTAIEEAEAYQRLSREFDRTQEQVAEIVGKSRSHVANALRLLTLPQEVRDMLRDGTLTAGHARAILNAPDPVALARRIVAEGLSVRAAERLGREARPTPAARSGPARPRRVKDTDTVALERELAGILGVAVAIDFDGKGGQLKLRYSSLEQLDDLIDRLTGRRPGAATATRPPSGFEENLDPGSDGRG